MVWPFSRRAADPGPAAVAVREQKASSVGPIVSARVLRMPQWARRSFEQLVAEGYQQNPISNACVYLPARAAASVPLTIMKGGEEADIPELRRLLNRPNPMMDGAAFVQATISDLLLAGEFFAERVDIGKAPKELYRWQPGRVSVDPGDDGFPQSYTFKVGNGQRVVPVDFAKGILPVLHVKDFHPTDDWRGMPNVDPAAWAIDAHTGALKWNVALLNNGAQPSGALIYAPKEGSDKLGDDQWNRLKAELDESFSGAKNAGKPLLLDGGLDWKEMGFSPKDMNYGEGLNIMARLIALAFGVPPLILGIPGDNTFANYAEANKAFYRQTVLPLLGQWGRAMTYWIGPAFGDDVSIVPDTDDLEVFADERAQEWARIEQSTSMTINEKRAHQGLEPVEGGDVILVSSMMVPLGDAGASISGGAATEDDAPEEDEDVNVGGDGEEDDA